MAGQAVSKDPWPKIELLHADGSGFDELDDSEAFDVATWNLWLSRLFRRASRGRVDGKRACQLAAVANAGVRAATAAAENQIKLEQLRLVEQWQRQQLVPQPQMEQP
jgi:hypothetical protein